VSQPTNHSPDDDRSRGFFRTLIKRAKNIYRPNQCFTITKTFISPLPYFVIVLPPADRPTNIPYLCASRSPLPVLHFLTARLIIPSITSSIRSYFRIMKLQISLFHFDFLRQTAGPNGGTSRRVRPPQRDRTSGSP
jgi:hypothetical protein